MVRAIHCGLSPLVPSHRFWRKFDHFVAKGALNECHYVLSLCLSDHETGAPVAIGFAAEVSKTDENKREGEQTVAKRLYQETPLDEATITGDALNCNGPQVDAILEKGGDYFFQIKDENRHAYQAAQRTAEEGTPLFFTPKNPISRMDALMSAR
jgi:hypothetical protein